MRPPRRLARGFSLVEVCVAVALVAMLSAIVVPAIGNLTRLDLRRGSRQLAGNVRRAFDEAALTGRTYRMTFRLPPAKGAPKPSKETEQQPPISIEAADGGLLFSGRDGALKLAADANYAAEDEGLSTFDNYFANDGVATGKGGNAASVSAEATHAASASAETFQAMFGINRLAKQGNKDNFASVGEVTLPAGVSVYAVWISGMLEAETHGSASLLFFPAGYTQDAILYLTDGNGNAMSVTIQALTGQCGVLEGALPVAEFEVAS